MRSTALGLAVSLYIGIESDLWYALWLGTLHNESRYIDAFLAGYGLEIATIGGDGGDIEVVRPRDGYLDYWIEITTFVLLPAGACLDGCTLSARPTP